MLATAKSYFGTNEPLAPSRALKAGQLNCLYELGNLRYINLGNTEIIRMIYAAVRDENWFTLPYTISNEIITNEDDGFKISYTAHYQLNGACYRALVRIEGKQDSSITFSMEGEALRTFYRNRIGLCVLHPITECNGREIKIIQPDGSFYTSVFPKQVSPHQPFKNVKEMHWQPNQVTKAHLLFSGEVFETEDHRNWTDNSYKTYSTPLELPVPVTMHPGEKMQQQITLCVDSFPFTEEIDMLQDEGSLRLTGKKYPFPKIGYSQSSESKTLTSNEIKLLQKVPFAHYRTEIRFKSLWQQDFQHALHEARQLNTILELVVFFDDDFESQLEQLLAVLKRSFEHVGSIFILYNQAAATPYVLMNTVYPLIKNQYPAIKVGYGTDAFFAELNRNPPSGLDDKMDFAFFSVNPQVHAFDTRSLIENLQGQHYALTTAKIIANNKDIHVSPLTLKPRLSAQSENMNHNPLKELMYGADARQSSEFTAAWMLISLRYLCQSASITLFETVGARGIIPGANNSESRQSTAAKVSSVFPVYRYLQDIFKFKPVYILESYLPNPLKADALLLENAKGEILCFIIDFEKGIINKNTHSLYKDFC